MAYSPPSRALKVGGFGGWVGDGPNPRPLKKKGTEKARGGVFGVLEVVVV